MGGEDRGTRIWYQSFVDPEEQRPYIERLKAHLNLVSGSDASYDVVGISPPDRYLHPITKFRIAGQVISNAIAAEEQGYDAFVIGHFQEPGLNECKGALGIPVIGPGEAAMLHALTIGRKVGHHYQPHFHPLARGPDLALRPQPAGGGCARHEHQRGRLHARLRGRASLRSRPESVRRAGQTATRPWCRSPHSSRGGCPCFYSLRLTSQWTGPRSSTA